MFVRPPGEVASGIQEFDLGPRRARRRAAGNAKPTCRSCIRPIGRTQTATSCISTQPSWAVACLSPDPLLLHMARSGRYATGLGSAKRRQMPLASPRVQGPTRGGQPRQCRIDSTL